MAILHRQSWGQGNVHMILDADPTVAPGQAATIGDRAEYLGMVFYKLGAGATAWGRASGMALIADPGNAGAIPVTRSGYCLLTSAGAETRTLAIPTFLDQELLLSCDTFVGNIAITVASAFDTAGNTIITMGNAKDACVLRAASVGAVLAWSIVANDGCALT